MANKAIDEVYNSKNLEELGAKVFADCLNK